MKKLLFAVVATILLCRTADSQMIIQSLSGPVTQTEIDSFKAFMARQKPQPMPWGRGGGHNMWADGAGGRELEALAEMYETTGDGGILTNMVAWADICTSQRNDLLPAAKGGQRVMWTGKIDKVWCPNSPGSKAAGYAGSENEDTEGHLAYCAKVIIENPSIWNKTVPDGDPFHYGVTYLDRAKNYLAKCDEANDEYSLVWIIQPGTSLIIGPTSPAWTRFKENVSANNRQMMFTSGFQRLAEAHELLGDNPARVAQYDAIVRATVTQDLNGMKNFHPETVKGQPVYNWDYYPTRGWGPETTEIHAEYDVLGLWRAYNRAAYGYHLSDMVPFANTFVDVIYLGSNQFANDVAGRRTHSPIYSGWMMMADWNPKVYDILATASVANGWSQNNADIDAGILFMKNRRYQKFSISARSLSPASYTVTVTPMGGFRGTVSLRASGLPSGATARFSSSIVDLDALDSAVTNVTMAISGGAADDHGFQVIGDGGGISHSVTISNSSRQETTIAFSSGSIAETATAQRYRDWPRR